MKTEVEKRYISFDGDLFYDEGECRRHEFWVFYHPGVRFFYKEENKFVEVLPEGVELFTYNQTSTCNFFDTLQAEGCDLAEKIDLAYCGCSYVEVDGDEEDLKRLYDYWGWGAAKLKPGFYKWNEERSREEAAGWVRVGLAKVRRKNGKDLSNL